MNVVLESGEVIEHGDASNRTDIRVKGVNHDNCRSLPQSLDLFRNAHHIKSWAVAASLIVPARPDLSNYVVLYTT